MKFLIVLGAIIIAGGTIWLGISIGNNDHACLDPNASVSCQPSTRVPARTSTSARTTTVVETPVPSSLPKTSARTTTTTPVRTSTSTPPLLAPIGIPATPTVIPTTTQQPVITPQDIPVKVGTLKSDGPIETCKYGGMPVAVGQTLKNNGVTFELKSSGAGGGPELVITGKGTYTYPEIRVTTASTSNPFSGHVQAGSTSVPVGKVNLAYDISTRGSTLQGVVICLGEY